MKAEDNKEISELVKEMAEGAIEELKVMIPNINLSPKVSDAEIKGSIIKMDPSAWERLFQVKGQKEVIDFVGSFTEGRRF